MIHELDILLGYRDPESQRPLHHDRYSTQFHDDDVSGVYVIVAPDSKSPLPYWQQALSAISRWFATSH